MELDDRTAGCPRDLKVKASQTSVSAGSSADVTVEVSEVSIPDKVPEALQNPEFIEGTFRGWLAVFGGHV
jgi:hypothetical protein